MRENVNIVTGIIVINIIYITIKACSHNAIATAIFVVCNVLHGIQCKCSQCAIVTMILNNMQPIKSDKQIGVRLPTWRQRHRFLTMFA